MKKYLVLLLFAALFLPATLQAGQGTDVIALTFPQSVIAETLRKVVPLTFSNLSSKMEGSITIADISGLTIRAEGIFCHINLIGNDLNLITDVAGQKLRLQLGSAKVDFDCQVQVRYDAKNRQILIRPVAQELDGSNALQKGDLGQALLTVFNGQEFGIPLQDIEPIIAQASNKTITIHTKIVDVRTNNGTLQVGMIPEVTATRH